jgi:hypothetical protein
MNRQRILLTILVGVLIASLAYAILAMPRQEQAPPRAAAPVAKGGAAGKAKPAVRLHLELLASESEPFPGTGRDIFRLRRAVPPPVTAPVALARPEAPPPPPPPSPPTAEELLRQALAGYKVLGFLEKGGVRSVFLANGPDVVVVRAGQPFGAGNRFVAAEVTATELVVASADRTATVRVSLGDVGSREPAIIAPVSVPRPGIDAEPSRAFPTRRDGRRVSPRPGVDMTGEPQVDDAGATESDAAMELPNGEGQ